MHIDPPGTYVNLDRWDEHDLPPMEKYLGRCFGDHTAPQWRACWIWPDDAVRFAEMGLSADEAAAWNMVPPLVREYRQVGFGADEAVDWHEAWFTPREASIWRAAGFTPGDVVAIRDATDRDDPTVIFWALTGLSPREVLEHIAAGTDPLAFLADLLPAHPTAASDVPWPGRPSGPQDETERPRVQGPPASGHDPVTGRPALVVLNGGVHSPARERG